MFPIRDSAPRYTFPYVNWGLIGVNFLAFFYELSLPQRFLNEAFLPSLGLVPQHVALFLHGYPIPLAAVLVPFLTSMFLHGGWLHIIGNMWMLYLFGDNVEDVFGHSAYLLFYLGCGFIAAATQVAFNLSSSVPTIGASGAIAGVMGAYLVRFPRAKVLTLIFIIFFITFVELPAWVILLYWFAVQFLSGAAALATVSAQSGGIAFFAHVGGFIAGAVLVFLAPRRQAYRWQ
jgi:membrane associated rhomboid family serine protease